jgi:hypothetical protein
LDGNLQTYAGARRTTGSDWLQSLKFGASVTAVGETGRPPPPESKVSGTPNRPVTGCRVDADPVPRRRWRAKVCSRWPRTGTHDPKRKTTHRDSTARSRRWNCKEPSGSSHHRRARRVRRDTLAAMLGPGHTSTGRSQGKPAAAVGIDSTQRARGHAATRDEVSAIRQASALETS